MVVWRGWGIVVPIIIILCANAVQAAVESLGGPEYWRTHSFPAATALLVAGALIWAFDLYLFRNPPRVLRDEQTGERLMLVPRHDLFFVRMRWWGLICAGAGVAVLVAQWTPGST